ncbi:S1 family peptidase [Kutzneria sp. NPDC052558]|uniref:S1 family peptidase n=1 Tax=Kutzneria sp. NPDC052558 TaxID=3364121 RepID=UPI0037CA2EAD
MTGFRRILASVLAVALVPVLGAGASVVGGTRASTADHPYVVFLTDAAGLQFCGGTLVRATKVVTAAHCAAGWWPSGIRVVAGRDDKDGRGGVTAKVAAIWLDPDYRSSTGGSDIAVLTLADGLSYGTLPLATPADHDLYAAGASATVLGWGDTSAEGDYSRYLMQASLPLVADAVCGQAYPEFRRSEMVCAGYPQGGVDTCQGDSGGPLVVAGRLAGVTSWGHGCAEQGHPGVYARVAAYSAAITAELG